jgi:glycosyltransferase involved in cell wall biosynthesis
MSTTNHKSKVTIGMPVFNGEKFLKSSIDSLLSQTYQNFELIISDNNSTDLTESICREYKKQDSRIKYYRQKENIGPTANFRFVLEQSESEYFMWAAVDDKWKSTFLEKNMNILLNNNNIVGSVSQIQIYTDDKLNSNNRDTDFSNLKKKLIAKFRTRGTYDMIGKYENKVRILLKKSSYPSIYSVFRTSVLKKSYINNQFVGVDAAILLNILKYGDLKSLVETLMYRYDSGLSTKGSISISKDLYGGFLSYVFPHYHLTRWCMKNLGLRIFFKNLDHFIFVNFASEVFLILDLILSSIIKINPKK